MYKFMTLVSKRKISFVNVCSCFFIGARFRFCHGRLQNVAGLRRQNVPKSAAHERPSITGLPPHRSHLFRGRIRHRWRRSARNSAEQAESRTTKAHARAKHTAASVPHIESAVRRIRQQDGHGHGRSKRLQTRASPDISSML